MSAVLDKITKAVQDRAWPEAPEDQPQVDVIIIGAGIGGMGTAIELRREGIENFIAIDKADELGGTWRANTYPGVAVDIPSIYYSFSYEPQKVWTSFFSKGAELKLYTNQVADKYDLRRHMWFNTRFLGADWDDANHLWTCRIVDEKTGDEHSVRARNIIVGSGPLEVPKLPQIDGIDTFAGKMLHTSKWDHDYKYEGKRIAVIGTGATALQLIPELAKVAGSLTVFQRTPIWVFPKPDFAIPKWMNLTINRTPGLRRAARAGMTLGLDIGIIAGALYTKAPWMVNSASDLLRGYYRRTIKDEVLREQLTPKYALGCKRPSVSNSYLQTFTSGKAALITEPIARITPDSVITADGTEHKVDALVCATGFKVADRDNLPPFPLRGRNGVDLGGWWEDNGLQAYQGVTVPNFPNLFILIGPYGFPAGSYIAMLECTARHSARAIAEGRRRGGTAVEIKAEPNADYYALCKKRNEGAMWTGEPCAGSNTYYVDYQGNPALRQSTQYGMWKGNKHFPLDDYSYTPTPGKSETTVAVDAPTRTKARSATV